MSIECSYYLCNNKYCFAKILVWHPLNDELVGFIFCYEESMNKHKIKCLLSVQKIYI